jgi:zinc protease
MPFHQSPRAGHTRAALAALALAALAPAARPGLAAQSAAPAAGARLEAPRIPHTKFTLPNGLTVVLHEDHSAPVATVSVHYKVGSKHEKPGRTGFAHLFEHIMFEGSQNVPEGMFDKHLESAGANNNGTTDNDRTLYYESMPSNALETALWLESDRLGFLLPTLDQKKLDGQRDVVKNERRQSYDNQPFGVAGEVIAGAIYPAGHPYSWSVIGSMRDLSDATLDDVKEFFRTYYTPNNAILVVAGDIDPAKVRQQITRYFGEIPRGPALTRPKIAPVTLAADKRLVLEDSKARLPQIGFVYPTVGIRSADDAPLTALGRVLTQDRTSRLTKLLVYDRQLATSVGAFQGSNEDVGEFTIMITPRPGASLTEIERVVDSVVTGLVAAPPTAAEVERYKNAFAVSTITGLQSVFAKARTLGESELYFGDPEHFRKDLADALAVTPADVHRVARQYMTKGRIVLSMVPAGQLNLVSKPELPYVNVTPKPAVQ